MYFLKIILTFTQSEGAGNEQGEAGNEQGELAMEQGESAMDQQLESVVDEPTHRPLKMRKKSERIAKKKKLVLRFKFDKEGT